MGFAPLLGAGAILGPAIFVAEISILLALLLAGIVHTVIRIVAFFKREKRLVPLESESRRKFLKSTAAIFPVVIIPTGLSGVARSYTKIEIPTRRISVAGLPAQLQGFKIAHLSDSHLGYYVYLDDLEEAVDKIKILQPDLVLVTGDISDDLDILPEAIEIINRLRPPHGTFASVGNHEYYRGINRVLKIFESAPFPMLINQSTAININGLTVNLGGADDPVHLRRDNSEFLKRSIIKTMGNLPDDTFKILMCHRPQGLDASAEIGINLVLAGHTHGGQLGFGGRSLLEPFAPDNYLWGIYHKDKATLYTSGGMGHWFPFRLGCPAEAPLLVLERS
jgi:hypothetical protein